MTMELDKAQADVAIAKARLAGSLAAVRSQFVNTAVRPAAKATVSAIAASARRQSEIVLRRTVEAARRRPGTLIAAATAYIAFKFRKPLIAALKRRFDNGDKQ
jgi:hypothetical protein